MDTYWFCPAIGKYVTSKTLLKWEDDLFKEGVEVGMNEDDADRCAFEDLSEMTGIGLTELSAILYSL